MSPPERGVGNSGGLPSLQQLADVLANAFHANEGRTLLEIAYSLGVPIFDGYGDGEQAEHWWEKMEVVLKSMNCPAERKVEVAVFFLSGSAASWWRNLKQTYSQSTVVTWEQFQESFNTRFYSLKFKLRKRTEFFNLQQGDMSVNDYKQKFQELFRYCPDVANSSTEMMIQFHLGLRKEIRVATACSQCATYLDVFQIALSVEASLVESSLGQKFKMTKRTEFFKLQQGDMSVNDYKQKFQELFCYCPDVANSSTEMMIQFHLGLRKEIRVATACSQCATYLDVFQIALSVEESLVESSLGMDARGGGTRGYRGSRCQSHSKFSVGGPRYQQSFKRANQSSGSSGEGSNLSTHRSRKRSSGNSRFSDVRRLDACGKTCIQLCGRCKKRHGGKCQQKSSDGCFKCGQQGHMQRECPARGGYTLSCNFSAGCFKCGQQGHMQRDCPAR